MDIEMTLNELGKMVNRNAREKGFYEQIEEIMDNPTLTGRQKEFIHHLWHSNRILLIISELSEGFEGMRHGNYSAEPKSGGLIEELADTQIRLADLCEDLGADLEKAVEDKHLFNQSRERMHGGKRS